MPPNPHRLDRTVVPHHYRLRVEPDLEAATFSGVVEIDVHLAVTVQQIVLNAHQIEIDQAALLVADSRVAVTGVTFEEEFQRVTLTLQDPVEAGPARLVITYRGILNDELVGFYRSNYTDVDGNVQTIATTQFEATDARRAFPCFDEPSFKATFGVTLVIPEHLEAFSNTREVARVPVDAGRVAVTFADTMVMSTYLVAMVVGPFEATEPVDVDGVPVRVVAPRGKLDMTGFALESAVAVLRYLAAYYAIPYPGDKVDHIAVPDFAFGAMENLGCIIYRENALLLDPATAGQSERMRVLDVVGHELAHMWFGDLVTMDWWDGIWLNEAFATFMEMKSTDAARPEWKRWLSFGSVERPWAYAIDALHSSRPIEFEVLSPTEANDMFDALTYGKGSSVLRMIEQYIGENEFRRGVETYLRAHSYANTVTADLWAGLNSASSDPVGAIMDTWILQPGFPQIEAELDDGRLRLTQRRFLSIPDETDQTLWKVPMRLRGGDGDRVFERRFLLDAPTAEVALDGPWEWVVANAGGHGFYRVTYDEGTYRALRAALQRLDPLERYCLIDDAWAFVEAGQLPIDGYLDLVEGYREETEQSVWESIQHSADAIERHLVSDRTRPEFGVWVTGVAAATFARLGWDPRPDDTDLDRRLRARMIELTGRIGGDAATLERARQMAQRWVEDPGSVDPDVGQASAFTAAAHGGMDDHRRFLEAFDRTNNPQIQLRLLQALSLIDDPDAVDGTLEAIVSGRIRSQDAARVTGKLFLLGKHGPLAWRRVRSDWRRVVGRMPTLTLHRMLEGIPGLSLPEIAADVRAFVAEGGVPASRRLDQQLERLDVNVAMRARETPRVEKRFGRD